MVLFLFYLVSKRKCLVIWIYFKCMYIKKEIGFRRVCVRVDINLDLKLL